MQYEKLHLEIRENDNIPFVKWVLRRTRFFLFLFRFLARPTQNKRMPGRSKSKSNLLVERVHAAVERIRGMEREQREVFVEIATTKFPFTFLSADDAMFVIGTICFMLYRHQRGEANSVQLLEDMDIMLSTCFEIHTQFYASYPSRPSVSGTGGDKRRESAREYAIHYNNVKEQN